MPGGISWCSGQNILSQYPWRSEGATWHTRRIQHHQFLRSLSEVGHTLIHVQAADAGVKHTELINSWLWVHQGELHCMSSSVQPLPEHMFSAYFTIIWALSSMCACYTYMYILQHTPLFCSLACCILSYHTCNCSYFNSCIWECHSATCLHAHTDTVWCHSDTLSKHD